MNATSQQMAARRYRIERYLTEGGMGAIYVGKKLGPGGFEKDVVLKQLLPEHTSRPEFRDLFFREAKISATLDHANIVHTFDLVESDESLFIVMEYVRGADLRTICRRAKLRRRQIAPAAAIQIALEILAGLSYAHTRRDTSGTSLDIIHRDVSPSNILCSAEGEVKLSDFGIAKASTHSSVFYRVRGKVGYMSPEQARNQPIDARTDLYSVAVCLYEALTSERLFVGDLSTPPDVIYGQPIAPPSYKRPGLPRALDHVMATALASDPDDRYQDARAFAEALRQVAHHHGMLSSAPQLAEDLRDILGDDPSRWLQEESDSYPAPDTQKIQLKALEGKEASSIGVVEGPDLYVVSAGGVASDDASAKPTPARADESEDFDFDSLLRLAPNKAAPAPKARTKPADSAPPEVKSASGDASFALQIDEEDVPTSPARAVTAAPARAAAPPPPSRAPAAPPAPPRVPPPPPRTVPVPPPARVAPPPPPPRPPAPARPPGLLLESPFEDEMASGVSGVTGVSGISEVSVVTALPEPIQPERNQEQEEFPLTPVVTTGSPPRGTPYANPAPASLPAPAPHAREGRHTTQPYVPHPAFLPAPHNGFAPPPGPGGRLSPARGVPVPVPAPVVPSGALRAPPARRSGPPGLLILVVLLAAAAGGAKLASLASRGDVASLSHAKETPTPTPTPTPTSAPATSPPR
jgi:eukaryotic-like serine/threonine-protein kinase